MAERLRPLTRWQARRRALFIGSAVLAATAAVVGGVLLNRDPDLDDHLCPVGRPLKDSVVVVVDTTDPLAPGEKQHFLDVVHGARDQLPRFGKLSLLLLDPRHPFQPEERISLCNPGSPGQLGVLFHTPKHVAQRWTETFEAPLEAVATELARSPRGAVSPIIETVVGVSWRQDFKATIPNRRLILISDMRQFTPSEGLSLYPAGDAWRRFLGSGVAQRADPDLAGSVVQIELIHRPEARLPETDLKMFWTRWFKSRGHTSKVTFDGQVVDPISDAKPEESRP